jgi:hypothetical protein
MSGARGILSFGSSSSEEARMKLSDAPVSYEGVFVTHFFSVRDQEKSKDFYVRVLGGKVIKSENPCHIELH